MLRIYEAVISTEKLKGRKNCEICYARHKGNYEDIVASAQMRNIVLTPMRMRDFYNARKAGVKSADTK